MRVCKRDNHQKRISLLDLECLMWCDECYLDGECESQVEYRKAMKNTQNAK